MKILKLKSILFSLMAVVMVTVFLTSCDKDIPNAVESDVNEQSAFEHKKDIEILSENGLSKATITVYGNDVSLLNEVKQGDFNIVPIFEQPAETLDQSTDYINQSISNNTEDSDGKMPVGIEVTKVELEEGAIGYTIDVKESNFSRSSGTKTHYSSCNGVKVQRFSGCVRVEVWQKKDYKSGYSYKRNSNCCNGQTFSYNGGSSDQIKVKLSGSTAYSLTWL